jgi:3-(3-hydroxy-phenyl)propionate hydroxylase
MRRTQVIVVGAGPVGCFAAYRLAQSGIDVLLLDANSYCPEDMRASTFHAPTLDMLDELGLLEALEAQGLRAPIYQYRNRTSGEVLSFDLGEIADVVAHPYRLQCEQFKLARLVTGLLNDHPHGEVKFDRKLLHFEQDETGVTVNVEAPLQIETYRADYLIGVDGANSLVRKWLGVNFEGFTYSEKFLTLSTAWPIERCFEDLAYVNYMADAKEWCVLLRVPTVWRVLVPATETDTDADLLSDKKKTKVFSGLMGDGGEVVTEHRTVYRVHQRVAENYHFGRVLLAGDAAHLNNPLGGFGMNSGIHDAWNLTEKLARILKDGADPDVQLDHYDRQRRTVMKEFVQSQSIRNKQDLELGDSGSQRQRQKEMELVLADPARRRAYLMNQSMVSARLREAEIA